MLSKRKLIILRRNSEYYMMKKKNETVNHIMSECSKLAKIILDLAQLGGKVDPLEIKIWPYKKIICAKIRICSRWP